MCLFIYTENPKSIKANTTENDIVCYKVLRANRTEYTETKHKIWFETPYTSFLMKLGETYTDKEKVIREWRRDDQTLSIGAGIFHSFKDIEDAIPEVDEWAEGNVIVECTIPKGTKMYEGFFDESECYGSKKIKVGTKICYVAKWLIEDDEELTKALVQDYGFEYTKVPEEARKDLPREYAEW